MAEDEGTFLLWTTKAGPSSRSLQPPCSFSHLLSRLRQSLMCISAVTAAPPPWLSKGDFHIDSSVVRGCKFGFQGQCLNTQLHSRISTWDTQSLLRRTFSAFTCCLLQASVCAALPTESRTHILAMDRASQPQLVIEKSILQTSHFAQKSTSRGRRFSSFQHKVSSAHSFSANINLL